MRHRFGRVARALIALLPATAAATKVPAIVNIGVGPTLGTVIIPDRSGPPPISVGVALRAEGWVSKKTLSTKKVMRNVPKKYKGMVRSMDDLHVVPLPVALIPDQAMVLPVNPKAAESTLRAVGWTPISLYLAHKVRPSHVSVAASPRLGWVSFQAPASERATASHHLYIGADLSPEYESPMKDKVGFAVGGNVGPGLVTGNPVPGGATTAVGVWVDGFVRVHFRKPIKVSI